MKQIKKMFAAVLAIAMLLAMTSCSNAGKWIAKTDKTEVPVGAYLMYESVYYQYSVYYVSDYTKSPLNQDIKVDDETTLSGADWIKKNAMDTVNNMIAVNEECARLGITLTDAEQAVIRESVADAWDTNGESYSKIGLAKDSLSFMYQFNKLNEKLFDYLYGNEGVQPVSDKEVAEYFEKNYSSVDYFRVSLKDSSSNTLNDADQAKIKAELEKYGDEFAAGTKTFDQIVTAYNKEHTSATVTASSNIGIVENSFSGDLATAITDCKEGKAAVVTYNSYMYLVGKNKIADETEDYLKDNMSTLRHEMKDEDFGTYIDGVLGGLSISVNDSAVNKYSPKWIESKLS